MTTPEDLELRVIVQGELFYRPINQEGALVSWTTGGLEIAVSFAKPTERERIAFNDGIFEMGTTVIQGIPWIAFRVFQIEVKPKGFGQGQPARVMIPWHECPFHAVRIDPDYRNQIQEFTLEAAENPELRLATNAILLDYPSSEVIAIRRFSLSPHFTREFLSSVLITQATHTWESYDNAVNQTFEQYPVGAIGESTRIRCRSGD